MRREEIRGDGHGCWVFVCCRGGIKRIQRKRQTVKTYRERQKA